MKGHLWAIESLLADMLLVDAYILLNSLGMADDEFIIIGKQGKCSLRTLVQFYKMGEYKIDTSPMLVNFVGGPNKLHFTTSLKCYIMDKVLQAIIMYGPTKVSRIFDEIFNLTT
jgi:hypothetical protein